MTKSLFIFITGLYVACSSPTNSHQDTVTMSDTSIVATEHSISGVEYAKKQLDECLKGRGEPFTWDTIIKTPSTAIAIAEPILFDVFGKDQILSEKPYEVYLLDGYWYIAGTIPKGWKGGGFEIIFSAKDARIIRLTHYK